MTYHKQLRDATIAHTNRLISEAGLKVHYVTARVKRPQSLAEKLKRKPGKYHALANITDLVALRIITYFESDVGLAARLVEENHTVNWEHSVDKSKMHDPDRFGYMSVHYVVRATSDIPELAEFAGAQFEIQIRSILQHAWAEIEHDLGYKNREAVPREVQRRFYRLAGLLEMADEEFMSLHRLARDYGATLPERIAQEPNTVFIDSQSMTHLINIAPVAQLDEEVAQALNVLLLKNWPDPERPQRLASLLHYVGVNTVGALQKELKRNHEDIVLFAAKLAPRLREAWTPAGGARPGSSVVHYALLRACAQPTLDPLNIVKTLGMRRVLSNTDVGKSVYEAYLEVMNKNLV